jgi:hypothetical protein
MATYSVHTAAHKTLAAATVDTVNLDVYGRYIQVVHRGSSTNPIYFSAARAAATPTVAGDDEFVVVAGSPTILAWPIDGMSTAQLKLISAGAEPYSVQVLADRPA